jgi:hypothetical protein
MATPFDPGANGGRDRRGRFGRGNLFAVGAGAAAHKTSKARTKLQQAIIAEVSSEDARRFVRVLLDKVLIEQDVATAKILAPYLLGRPVDPISDLQAHPPTKIVREIPMDLEAIATTTQQVLEAFAAGRLSEADANTARSLLETLLKARHMTDVATQLEQVHHLLEELNERSRHA